MADRPAGSSRDRRHPFPGRRPPMAADHQSRASEKLDGNAPVLLHSASGRWIVAGSVLGSGAVFLEGSVVNVARPAIARDFGLGVEGLQWVINGYLLTLSALMLLGGTLGDRFPRSRVFAVGCVAFAAASVGCALAPSLPHPLLPLEVFRSRQFTGANVMTLLVYAALNGLLFLLMPQLQNNLGYSALTAGAALLPVSAIMLALSPVAGRLALRIG